MPENQSQAHTGGNSNPDSEPQIRDEAPEARSFSEGPSDTEAAHAQDGGAVRDPRADMADSADANRGDLGSRFGRDPREDYGSTDLQADKGGEQSQDRESFQGTAAHTAGAEFADRMPEASKTEVDEQGRPIDR
jgi:hypothetical protein